MCAHIWLPSTRTVRLCIKENSASRLRLQNPCQFCGQEYKRRDAHLRSCIGVFNGVYLHRRVARGKALSLSGASPCDPLSSTDVRATGTTHADRAHACHPRTEPSTVMAGHRQMEWNEESEIEDLRARQCSTATAKASSSACRPGESHGGGGGSLRDESDRRDVVHVSPPSGGPADYPATRNWIYAMHPSPHTGQQSTAEASDGFRATARKSTASNGIRPSAPMSGTTMPPS